MEGNSRSDQSISLDYPLFANRESQGRDSNPAQRLFANEKTLRKAIMKIETDSRTVEEAKVPEECNVYKLYCCFASDKQRQELAGRYRTGGVGYGEIKQVCFEAIRDELKEATEVYQRIRDDRVHLEGILEAGRDTALRVSREVIGRVRERVGL